MGLIVGSSAKIATDRWQARSGGADGVTSQTTTCIAVVTACEFLMDQRCLPKQFNTDPIGSDSSRVY
jgi:hypothetical protein